MRRLSLASSFILCILILGTGCSNPGDRYKAKYKEGLKALGELNFAFVKITKADQGPGASSEIVEICSKLRELKIKIDEAEPKDEKLKEKILKFETPLLSAILGNLASEQQRVSSLMSSSMGGGMVGGKVTASGINSEASKATLEICKEFEKLDRTEKDTKKTTK